MTEEEHTDVTNGTGDEQDADDQSKAAVKKSARHDGGVADLERVTDYAEEKELSSADITNVSKIRAHNHTNEHIFAFL